MKNQVIAMVVTTLFFGTACANDPIRNTLEDTIEEIKHKSEPESAVNRKPREHFVDVDKELALFEKVYSKMLQKNATLTPESRELTKRYRKEGKNILHISYENEANYPLKMSGNGMFLENRSQIFFEQTSKQIFTEILGNDYQKYSPQLGGVSRRGISMTLLFSDSRELKTLISHPLAGYAGHAGNHVNLVEITPLSKKGE